MPPEAGPLHHHPPSLWQYEEERRLEEEERENEIMTKHKRIEKDTYYTWETRK